jgi:hypothetical protein
MIVKKSKATKAAKPAKKTKAPKKAKSVVDQLMASIQKGPPPPSLYDIAMEFDNVCNRLSEISSVMNAALGDGFTVTDDHTATLLCLAERMIKDTLNQANDLTSDLYLINRHTLTK